MVHAVVSLLAKVETIELPSGRMDSMSIEEVGNWLRGNGFSDAVVQSFAGM